VTSPEKISQPIQGAGHRLPGLYCKNASRAAGNALQYLTRALCAGTVDEVGGSQHKQVVRHLEFSLFNVDSQQGMFSVSIIITGVC